MAEMIKPKKEDIVVLGRIVSASTEGVVANAEQVYDGVSNMRQHEINKKFLSGNYTINESNIKDNSITTSKISQDVWNKLRNEYLRLDSRNTMDDDATIVINRTKIDGDGVSVNDGNVKIDKDGFAIDEDESYYFCFGNKGIIFIVDDSEGSVSNQTYKVDTLGNTLSKGIATFDGFKTNDRSNIGLLSNDGTIGLALTDSEISSIASSTFTMYNFNFE